MSRIRVPFWQAYSSMQIRDAQRASEKGYMGQKWSAASGGPEIEALAWAPEGGRLKRGKLMVRPSQASRVASRLVWICSDITLASVYAP